LIPFTGSKSWVPYWSSYLKNTHDLFGVGTKEIFIRSSKPH
jgi:hypothetical protein